LKCFLKTDGEEVLDFKIDNILNIMNDFNNLISTYLKLDIKRS